MPPNVLSEAADSERTAPRVSDPEIRQDDMGNATTSDVKKLLELAVRMGIPASDAMHQVRELSTEPEPSDKYADAPAGPRRPA